MKTIVDLLGSEIKRVLIGQLTVTVVLSIIIFLYQGLASTGSALFGGLVAIVLSWWLGVGARRLGASKEKTIHMLSMVIGFVQRMLLMLVLFGIGLYGLHLDPRPMIATFCIAYIVYWIELYRMGKKDSENIV